MTSTFAKESKLGRCRNYIQPVFQQDAEYSQNQQLIVMNKHNKMLISLITIHISKEQYMFCCKCEPFEHSEKNPL